MLIIAFLPKQYTDAEELFTYTPLLKSKRFSAIYNGILTMFFSFVVILVRAFSFRLNESILDNETLYKRFYTLEDGTYPFAGYKTVVTYEYDLHDNIIKKRAIILFFKFSEFTEINPPSPIPPKFLVG